MDDIDLGGGKRSVRLAPPGGESSLSIAKAVDEALKRCHRTSDRWGVGFFLEADDFERDYTAMRAAGVHFEETPRDEPYGIVAVWQDPLGNRWDSITFART